MAQKKITKENCIAWLIKQGHNAQEAVWTVNKHFDGYMARNPQADSIKRVATTMFMWG